MARSSRQALINRCAEYGDRSMGIADVLAILASAENLDGSLFRLPVESAPPTSEASHATQSVPANAWTTVVSVTPAGDRGLMSMMADLAALLGTRYQLRLTIGGDEQLRETVHTDQVSAIPLHGLLAPGGSPVALQAFHAETLAQDITGTLIHRAA